ncbi:hypothetical protein ACB496_15265 [Lelliottia nimipressuralis]|uniref:hypothetical protein n=1 Tax=Lelliottia nimipressuralis TaxID=69220 RepID=UPI00355817A0
MTEPSRGENIMKLKRMYLTLRARLAGVHLDEEGQQSVNLLKGMATGVLPGVLLCAVLTGYLKDNVALANTETYLAAQDITLSGTVTAPSCTVKLENNRLMFTRQQQDAQGVQSSRHNPTIQTLRLNLSQCEVDGVGVMFKAEYWPDNPVRGTLRDRAQRQRNDALYYTISPGADEENPAAWPLTLAEDSPQPEADKQQEENRAANPAQYFSLAEMNYWYDLKTPLKENDVLVIPFNVRVHRALTQKKESNPGELESNFTLQLSWR